MEYKSEEFKIWYDISNVNCGRLASGGQACISTSLATIWIITLLNVLVASAMASTLSQRQIRRETTTPGMILFWNFAAFP